MNRKFEGDTRDFLAVTSKSGVVDVEAHSDVVYVFVRSGLTTDQCRMLRDLAMVWWGVSRCVVTSRSGVEIKAVPETGLGVSTGTPKAK